MNNFEPKAEVTQYVGETKIDLETDCPKCRARILISGDQLRNEMTYHCPKCAAVYNMATAREALQEIAAGKQPDVEKTTTEISINCPKCRMNISVRGEQLGDLESYRCPQCSFAIDLEPIKRAMQEVRAESGGAGAVQGKVHIDKYVVAGICHKCQTRIPVSTDQLCRDKTFTCPHCGEVHDMEPLRQAVRGKSFYGPGYKDKHDAVYPLPGVPLLKMIRLRNVYYISIVAIVVILVVLVAMFFYGIFK